MSLFKQEFYKLQHKRSTWGAFSLLVGLMAFLAVVSRRESSATRLFYVTSAYAGFQWIALLVIVISATCVTMEFDYGTIKQLALQTGRRRTIFWIKYAFVILICTCLHLAVIGVTWGLKNSVSPQLHWSQMYQYHQNLIQLLVHNAELSLYGSLLIISLTFCLASFGHSSGVSTTLSLGFCFLGEGLSTLVLRMAGQHYSFLRWNPFNMLNLQNEYGNPAYSQTTHLTLMQLAIGNLGWTLAFLIIGSYVFSHRRI